MEDENRRNSAITALADDPVRIEECAPPEPKVDDSESDESTCEYDLVVAAWGRHEANIGSLDDNTYRHHLQSTLQTLLDHAPRASCVVMGPVESQEAVRVELVRTVQRAVADELGCAFFDPDKALPDSPSKRAKAGFVKGGRLTPKGQRELASVLLTDLLSWNDYAQAKKAQEIARAEEAAALAAAQAAAKDKASSERERLKLAPIEVGAPTAPGEENPEG